LPQAPQFWGSLPIRLTHWPLQAVWPVPQVVPPGVEGVAHPAAKRSARLKQAASADKKGLRTSMVRTPST